MKCEKVCIIGISFKTVKFMLVFLECKPTTQIFWFKVMIKIWNSLNKVGGNLEKPFKSGLQFPKIDYNTFQSF